jgi:LysR family hydrogen peroxide-inducible transcriptional activator
MATLTQLEYIVAVHRTKHFGRAAKECHVSQPSLSAQIHKVEEELDFIIFDRSKKPIKVTDSGLKFIQQAKKVLAEHKKLLNIQSDSQEIQGDFHLGVIPTLSAYILPIFLESFTKKYPKVNLHIGEYQTKEIINKLYDDELDGALLVTPLNDSQIIERSLFYEPFYVYVSSSHELSTRKIIKETDLDENSVWLLDEGHCFRDQVIKLCSLKNQRKIFRNVEFKSGNMETLKALVRKVGGYTLLPHLATLDLPSAEKQKHLKKFSKPTPTREVSLVHSRSFLKEPILEALQKEILNNIPSELASIKKGNMQVIDI